MEKLINILKDIKPEIDFEKENSLIDDGLIDSFDIIAIISEINEQYNIEIEAEDITPENFNSLESINNLINRLL